jgi:hypothetical protein
MEFNIVGGGIAGCTLALELSKIGKVNLYEKKNYILNNGPYCRLHCGLMYPMLSLKESAILLTHSIEFAQKFPQAILKRPCVITYNKNSKYNPSDLIKKCNYIQTKYSHNHSHSRYLESPDIFYAIYTRNDILHFKMYGEFIYSTNQARNFHDPFVKTFCTMLKNIDSIKYPFVSVNEFGIEQTIVESIIRHRITTTTSIKLYLNMSYENKADFTINAKGACSTNNGLLELKSSYLVKCKSLHLPEIAIIGERETDIGMIQISPRKNNQVQVHYMNCNSTLFQRVTKFSDFTLQNQKIIINNYIPPNIIQFRTQCAINQINKYLSINIDNKSPIALWGCQFIPGHSKDTRTSNYTKNSIEIVKAISSVTTAKCLAKLFS